MSSEQTTLAKTVAQVALHGARQKFSTAEAFADRCGDRQDQMLMQIAASSSGGQT